jgi:dipeptidyl aminopeptidase/acylaminoacyl peptidase
MILHYLPWVKSSLLSAAAILASATLAPAHDDKATPRQDANTSGFARFAAIKDVRSALLSPDGKIIACIVAVSDLKANRVKSEVWLMPVAEGKARKLAFETDAVDRILWSPQGHQLALVGTIAQGAPNQEWGPHLWVVDVDTGKSKRLTRIDRSNHYLAHQGANVCWSPDGAQVAYLASEPAGPRARADGPLVVDRIQYKTRTAFSDNRATHIWTVEVATEKTRQLTKGRFDEHSIDWSPKGDEIVFCSNRGKDPDANWNNDLYIVKVKDGAVEQLTKTAGNEMSPAWSPDGRSLAYTMTKRPATTIDSVAEDDHVWVLDRSTGKARELTAKLDRRCAHVRWNADSKSVLFLARDRGRSLLFRVPIDGGPAAPLFSVAGMVTGFSLPHHSERGICILSTPTQPAEVWSFSRNGSEPGMRTRFNVAAAARWQMVSPREFNFKSFDGTPIQGWVMLPPGATADKKAPTILYIHGGPHGMYGLAFSATFQLMCAHGYALVFLNPRGSHGYGQRFSDGCLNDWGGADYKDLMAGLDHALAKYPELDSTRLAVTGGSYGGYMTEWIVTQTDRFKAAMAYAGLSNLISFYATSLYQDLIHVEFGGEPWDRYDILWERSPLRHIKRAKTPTLILHGEADFDVHITQSEELYTALKRRGVETVFVRYPREGHGATEPRHQLDQLERTSAWFDRFLRPK